MCISSKRWNSSQIFIFLLDIMRKGLGQPSSFYCYLIAVQMRSPGLLDTNEDLIRWINLCSCFYSCFLWNSGAVSRFF